MRRTTILIPEDILAETMRVSGSRKMSEAVVNSLTDYLSLKRRLAFLEHLKLQRPLHRLSELKRGRNRIKKERPRS